jgi:hypothetical protein
MVVLNHLAADCSLLLAAFKYLKFGVKFILLSKIEIIDGGEVLNSNHASSTHNSFPFIFLRSFTYSYE